MDRVGQTADLMLRATRDVTAAKLLFSKAIGHQGQSPESITIDGYVASQHAVSEMNADGLPMQTHKSGPRSISAT
ncbi:MAG: DDE-type integrase/transposase/recombinase [Paraburkholderia sp.]